MASYKFETVTYYDTFKVEVRKLESETSDSIHDVEKGKCNSINEKEKKGRQSKLGDVKTLLE